MNKYEAGDYIKLLAEITLRRFLKRHSAESR
jgi:hypothetical protein